MSVSHAFRRACVKNSKPELDENSLIHNVHFVIWNLPVSNKSLEQFKEETQKDPTLQTLVSTVLKVDQKKNFPHQLQP